MTPSANAYRIIKLFEGLSLAAYKCPAGKNTIGFGSIMYPDGTRVKMGDKITRERADELLAFEVNTKARSIAATLSNVILNQNQFDALVSFAYNVGVGALQSSTLLKKVRVNPGDPSIRQEFARWNKAAAQVLPGLTRRRKIEADLYFKP